MEFGWINIFGAAVVVLMLLPNIVYAIRSRGEENLCASRAMNLIEQIGRYACIVLMWLPLPVMKFGFASVAEMLLYLGGNAALLLAYWVVFMLHMKKRRAKLALAAAVLPACIFLMSGLLLRHWLLAAFSLVFAVGHIYVTQKNMEAAVRAQR